MRHDFMALITEFQCRHCGQPRTEVVTSSRICAHCRGVIDKANEEAHMAKLAAKPLEERVRCIELALYRLDADARLKAMEAHHVRY